MVESKNKTLWVGLAAAGALIGAALLFHWATSAEDEDDGTPSGSAGSSSRDKLQKDLEGADLIAVKKTAQGMLDSQYFLSLLQFVGQTARDRTKSLRLKCQEDRRKFYKTEEWDQYEAVIKKALEAEDQAAQAVVKEVIDFL